MKLVYYKYQGGQNVIVQVANTSYTEDVENTVKNLALFDWDKCIVSKDNGYAHITTIINSNK